MPLRAVPAASLVRFYRTIGRDTAPRGRPQWAVGAPSDGQPPLCRIYGPPGPRAGSEVSRRATRTAPDQTDTEGRGREIGQLERQPEVMSGEYGRAQRKESGAGQIGVV